MISVGNFVSGAQTIKKHTHHRELGTDVGGPIGNAFVSRIQVGTGTLSLLCGVDPIDSRYLPIHSNAIFSVRWIHSYLDATSLRIPPCIPYYLGPLLDIQPIPQFTTENLFLNLGTLENEACSGIFSSVPCLSILQRHTIFFQFLNTGRVVHKPRKCQVLQLATSTITIGYGVMANIPASHGQL